jgi:hypothetical protein
MLAALFLLLLFEGRFPTALSWFVGLKDKVGLLSYVEKWKVYVIMNSKG